MIRVRKNVNNQDIWMRISSKLEKKGSWTEDIGVVELTYVPGELVIDTFEVEDTGLKIDSLARAILEEVKQKIEPKYLEIVIRFSLGKSIFINYGSDEGWGQVATFRFSEPKFS